MSHETEVTWGIIKLKKGNTMKKLLVLVVLLLAASLSSAQEKRYTVPIEDSPILGPADAPITMIEFLDYQ